LSLTKPRLTPARQRTLLNLPVSANVLCYAGALAVLDIDGYVRPGFVAQGIRGLGRFKDTFDNTGGAAGDISADIELGVFQYANSSGGNAVDATDIGAVCWVVDDQTVASTSGAGARGIAGTVADVDADGVWVDFISGAVAPNKRIVRFSPISTKAADADVKRALSGVGGRITRFWSISNAALAAGDATLQLKINGVNVTTGLITITQAGSAAGDVDAVNPTAANRVAADDVISVTGGGASTATATAECFVEVTY